MALVAEKAASALGREAVLGRQPVADREALVRELARVSETMDFLGERSSWGPPPIPDARPALQRLGAKGSVLEAQELHAVGVLLRSSRELAEEFDRRTAGGEADGEAGGQADGEAGGAEGFPGLAPLRRLLHAHPETEERIERTVDSEGAVLDTASPELGRIRSRLRIAHSRIVRKLEGFIGSLPERYVVSDASVTIRDGRYVVPIRREGKSDVGGIIHDESATGSTLFVEPPVALALMNALKELEREEQREIRRVLAEITDGLRGRRDALAGSWNALVDFDSLHARARAAMAWEGEPPELLEPGVGSFRVVRGRHPLLLAGEDDVIPFDLEIEGGERAVVVSGPNTGGKSVFLKSVGLIAALTQSGCVPPVGKGTSLPVFDDFFADIGDEQSIAESLSTFSAHLENLKELVEGADRESLVLIDEMGTGTDPAEGAALARAILEELVARGALCIVTSHLGALKTLDTDGSGIVNASLQFDPDRMEPTYRFVKGRPGRSYGLAIARRLGFPGRVLDRAEDHISEGEASVDDLLEKLERREKEAEELVTRLTREKDEAERLRAEAERARAQAEERAEELRQRENSAERRAREEARELLLEARKEVEGAIEEVRGARDREGVEEAARSARRRVEEAARKQREGKPSLSRDGGEAPDLEEGMRVRLASGQGKGTVLEVRDGRAVVDVGGLRMELPATDLVPLPSGDSDGSSGSSGSSGGSGNGDGGDGGGEKARRSERRARRGKQSPAATLPEEEPAHEIDLRGLRVDEVEMELGRGLDAAVLAELGEVRIIHGKGTGAVRSRVQELLKLDKRVGDFRLGRRGEGGTGVTVAKVG